MAEKTGHFAVKIDKAQATDFSRVVREIVKAGMIVEREMPRIGIVTGFLESDKIASLEKIEGVKSVAEAKKVGILSQESQ